MKAVLRFLRSMKFGLILMALLVVCSLAGSFIQQGKEIAYYQAEYPSLADALLFLRLDRVFSSWYFVLIMALLCLNLLLCSVLRLKNVTGLFRAMPFSAARAALAPLPCTKDKLAAHLKARRFRPLSAMDGKVWARDRIGHYGTFIVHLSLLLLLLASAAALYFPTTEDLTLRVGETLALPGGGTLRLDDFRALSQSGEIAYASTVSVTDENGDEKTGEISVNGPLAFTRHKLFQVNCGADGRLRITAGGVTDELTLAQQDWDSFLTLDGERGVTYCALYPDYEKDENGQVTPKTDTNRGYVNPIYAVYVTDGDNSGYGMVTPGTTLRVGEVDYAFDAPVSYSVLRLKTYPPLVYPLLYLSFALLIAGIWLAFFQSPVYVRLEKDGYAVTGLKPAPETEAAIRALAKTK